MRVSVARVFPRPRHPCALPALSPGRGAWAGAGGGAAPRSRPGLCSPSARLPSFICRLPLPSPSPAALPGSPRRGRGRCARCLPAGAAPAAGRRRSQGKPTWKGQKEGKKKKKSTISPACVAPPASRLALLLRGWKGPGGSRRALGTRLSRPDGHD